MLIEGAFLSTMMPVIGPAVTLFPTLSVTVTMFVEALAVSVPFATLVVRVKLAGEARPEPPSFAMQEMLTSVALQPVGAAAHA